eukprot:CAMPEP_0117523264 /NCGR_PEP_ID=MMETSP0784-20121206/34638_1 /TAXON_ID=39447 /ORGANISM="" /LENGTH=53 /DNA_ID=CAMNT_0005319371 /DNA_START=7 /DNA_END=164 /DNA_ORIENTATION=+
MTIVLGACVGLLFVSNIYTLALILGTDPYGVYGPDRCFSEASSLLLIDGFVTA